MSEEVLIFEVSESGFPRYVIENSHKAPVLVEFMGVWSEPCVLMAEVISELAWEFAGQFVFAKVDVDEQPGLREQFKVENVPTLLVFKDGVTVVTVPLSMIPESVRSPARLSVMLPMPTAWMNVLLYRAPPAL